MIHCEKLKDITLKEFYNQQKERKNSILLGKIWTVEWEINHYYGLKLATGEEVVVKCIDKPNGSNKNPVFISVNGSPGSILIDEVLWEKSQEEMFKPDCCNG